MNAFAKAAVPMMEAFPQDLRIPFLMFNCNFTEFHKSNITPLRETGSCFNCVRHR
jgi:hypothetical protein